ncbi:MAG: type II toxin-antitoxin system Phd/YefM family antitoxin [Muribaculaceae bacterium]|nr:type II toxin-antitoxin system Phd/YefM family antitoxin [Roseburia sp.]MCM1430026.1 type II toxin-antitoxin system Phd/YefM family antitoxin [Muribaculaceae bacterium]MCM1492947.1 type II toxin-antitoxin system Phd/YefM family antitoxin [Muribaculaceae bacterium]
MIATKQIEVRENIKKYFDMAFEGEPVVVSCQENKNVVIISESEYNELAKAKRNAEYLKKSNKADEQIKNGQVVTKTMDELLSMEN